MIPCSFPPSGWSSFFWIRIIIYLWTRRRQRWPLMTVFEPGVAVSSMMTFGQFGGKWTHEERVAPVILRGEDFVRPSNQRRNKAFRVFQPHPEGVHLKLFLRPCVATYFRYSVKFFCRQSFGVCRLRSRIFLCFVLLPSTRDTSLCVMDQRWWRFFFLCVCVRVCVSSCFQPLPPEGQVCVRWGLTHISLSTKLA